MLTCSLGLYLYPREGVPFWGLKRDWNTSMQSNGRCGVVCPSSPVCFAVSTSPLLGCLVYPIAGELDESCCGDFERQGPVVRWFCWKAPVVLFSRCGPSVRFLGNREKDGLACHIDNQLACLESVGYLSMIRPFGKSFVGSARHPVSFERFGYRVESSRWALNPGSGRED